MALQNLLACITTTSGKVDLPCIILHSKSRDVSLLAARSILAELVSYGRSRIERHNMPAADAGKHATYFDYETAPTSLLVDLSQSETARVAAIDWLTPIAPTKHIKGFRRSIVIHCSDLLSWDDQNALKTIIESSRAHYSFSPPPKPHPCKMRSSAEVLSFDVQLPTPCKP